MEPLCAGVRDFDIYEVGPRDGLQNLPHAVSVDDRIRLVKMLSKAGLRDIEVASFVNPRTVPTMAGAAKVMRGCRDIDARLSALVPNARGLHDAIDAGTEYINLFLSGDETFNHRNLGKSLRQASDDYYEMLEVNEIRLSKVRTYISLAFSTAFDKVEDAVYEAEKLGYKIVLSDTDGTATPDRVRQVIGMVEDEDRVALHLHYGEDKCGEASRTRMDENLTVAYECGVREFDASISGLGGCPFVRDSHGNLDTLDLIRWADQEGLDCGVRAEDLTRVWAFADGLRAQQQRDESLWHHQW